MKKQTAILLLFFVSIVWGGGFVATRMSLDYGVSVGLTNALRGLIFTVMIFICFHKPILKMNLAQLKIGLAVGVFNFLGFLLQTIGAEHTTPSSSAFLTTTNVVMVPFLAWIFLKQKPKLKNFIAIILCLLGMAILTGMLGDSLNFNIGDIYTLACALAYAISIVMLAKPPEGGHFAASAFLMGATHFLGGFLYFLTVEKAVIPTVDWSLAILPIIYLGLGSSFLAQTAQVMAQKYVTASTACLIMMLEAVWGSVFSIMFGYEMFTRSLVIGGFLIVISLMLSELDVLKKPDKAKINN